MTSVKINRRINSITTSVKIILTKIKNNKMRVRQRKVYINKTNKGY